MSRTKSRSKRSRALDESEALAQGPQTRGRLPSADVLGWCYSYFPSRRGAGSRPPAPLNPSLLPLRLVARVWDVALGHHLELSVIPAHARSQEELNTWTPLTESELIHVLFQLDRGITARFKSHWLSALVVGGIQIQLRTVSLLHRLTNGVDTPSLRSLDLHCPKDFNDASLKLLTPLTSLTKLTLQYSESIRGSGLAHLRQLPSLNDLTLEAFSGLRLPQLIKALKQVLTLERFALLRCHPLFEIPKGDCCFEVAKESIKDLLTAAGVSGRLQELRLSEIDSVVRAPSVSVLPALEGFFVDAVSVEEEIFHELAVAPRLSKILITRCGLSTVAANISRLTCLTELRLRGNRLTTLPSSIGELRALRHLDISENPIEALPKQLAQLKGLTSLSLRCERAIPLVIFELEGLTKLSVNWVEKDATELPAALRSLKKLETLYANVGFPPEISQCTRLQEVAVLPNRSTWRVPSPVLGLPVTTLILRHFNWPSVPEAIFGIAPLKVLDLEDNKIATLPREIGNLTALETLNLSVNALVELPGTIRQLRQLQVLNVASNSLKSLPSSICAMPKLQDLNAADNQLEVLPSAFAALRSLRSLDVSFNALTALPSGIENLPSLAALCVVGNRIVVTSS